MDDGCSSKCTQWRFFSTAFALIRPAAIPFKAELLTGRDCPRLSNESNGANETIGALCRAGALPKYLAGEFREAFQVSPGEVALERGTLAAGFESSLKAPAS